ncbi:hypothetical protein [Anabaena sp. PCC 7108]|uniref:hypothetical protein n=1 Tax=Anabaena sp. PCC 7108 TaxID=163908 RepID=UPI000362B5DC|nr:hypothetical protein [Anabaena sp. PCC 7108]
MLGIKAKISVSMKKTQVIKIALIPILAISTLLSISKTALADYLRSEGFGGEYRYELWSSDDSSDYYLKIWDKDEDTQKNKYYKTRSFKSSREALIYFDCNYARNSSPECPKQ